MHDSSATWHDVDGHARARPTRAALAIAACSHLCAALLMSACQAQAPAAPAAGDAAPSRTATLKASLELEMALRRRIEVEIGEAACTSDAQCRTLPIGAQSCGGPESWMAWSVASGRADVVLALADDLAAMQRQRNRRFGILSTCQVVPDPGSLCRERRCVLRPHPRAD